MSCGKQERARGSTSPNIGLLRALVSGGGATPAALPTGMLPTGAAAPDSRAPAAAAPLGCAPRACWCCMRLNLARVASSAAATAGGGWGAEPPGGWPPPLMPLC